MPIPEICTQAVKPVTPTNYRDVYAKIVLDYKIFYRIKSDEIQILRVWDTRQHPYNTEI
ncbi:MAG: hypothetical protein EA359_15435 [Balneolaceae bacterium]|nr:MAG: hypothetical protein EA359_15435 [Balneolaceae bacterium]